VSARPTRFALLPTRNSPDTFQDDLARAPVRIVEVLVFADTVNIGGFMFGFASECAVPEKQRDRIASAATEELPVALQRCRLVLSTVLSI